MTLKGVDMNIKTTPKLCDACPAFRDAMDSMCFALQHGNETEAAEHWERAVLAAKGFRQGVEYAMSLPK